MCEKSFMSDYFLQQHVQRRHPDALPSPLPKTGAAATGDSESSSGKVEEMEKEMEQLKQRLQNTEMSLGIYTVIYFCSSNIHWPPKMALSRRLFIL